MSQQAKKPIPIDRKLERFVRIVAIPNPSDTLVGYQVELAFVDGDKVVRRRLVDKPNLFEYAFATGADFIDPRNASFPDEK